MYKSVIVTLAAVLAIAAGKPSIGVYTQPSVAVPYTAAAYTTPLVKQYAAVPQTYSYPTPVIKYSTPVSYKSYVPYSAYTAPAVASVASVAPVAPVGPVATVARVASVAPVSPVTYSAVSAPVVNAPVAYSSYPVAYSSYSYPKYYSNYGDYETYAPISYSYDPSSPFYWKRK